jgi:hypothetical protein
MIKRVPPDLTADRLHYIVCGPFEDGSQPCLRFAVLSDLLGLNVRDCFPVDDPDRGIQQDPTGWASDAHGGEHGDPASGQA